MSWLRQKAETLTGGARSDALAAAARWERKPGEYVEGLALHE